MLRNLAIALVLWLCRRFQIVPLEQGRLRMGNDAVARSERWEAFYREEGGLADMIAALRREAFEAAAELPPEETEKVYYWAMSDRNLRRLDQQVQAVISTGKIEKERRDAIARSNLAVIRR